MQNRLAAGIYIVLLITGLMGCQHMGVQNLARDRRGYGEVIGVSWKEQMLLNIVKHRYVDTPVYLDVSSVVSSYSYQGEVSLGAAWFPVGTEFSNRSLGVTGQFTEAPTVSYAPLTGEHLATSLLRPIPPETIFAMLVSGRRATLLANATMLSINGIRNASSTGSRRPAQAQRFAEVVETLDRINNVGALRITIEKNADGGSSAFVSFDDGDDEEIAQEIGRLRTMLQLDPAIERYRLSFGPGRQRDAIIVLTRSMQQLIGELAAGVEVPESELNEGRVTDRGDESVTGRPPMRILSGDIPPSDAYVKTRYRERWFWVEDRDLASKRMFVFLLMFWSLVESRTQPHVPVLTLPLR